MSNAGSVAPKERVNIVYKPSVGDAKEKVEIPFKVVAVGDFTLKEEERSIIKRDLIDVNKTNFDEVLEGMNVDLDISVPDRLSNEKDAELDVHLDFKKLKDFRPESIVEQVPQLKKVMELRSALLALKGPLGNVPTMKKTIQNILEDRTLRNQLEKELTSSK
jgi:type VI secretion system protein ImpB